MPLNYKVLKTQARVILAGVFIQQKLQVSMQFLYTLFSRVI